MSMNPRGSLQTMRGRIRRRLLVNAVVDPAEAAARLPDGIRPHVTPEGTVVGCCLLELESVRPAGLPASSGRHLRAAAHRISVEWDDDRSGSTIVGVYVPVRHTDSRLAVALGGRWFPGVHKPARIDVAATDHTVRWRCDPTRERELALRVAVSIPASSSVAEPRGGVGATCLAASIGVSSDHRGSLESVCMQAAHRNAREVHVDELASRFIDGFSSAQIATSYLVCDADVSWTRPSGSTHGAPSQKVVGCAR